MLKRISKSVRSSIMSERHVDGPLQPGDRAPNIVLDAITRQGKIALDDFRGHSPILVGLFRGLHCPFCRLHIRYHPLPNLLAASDPERISHRAFGLPNLEFTESETEWPRKMGMNTVM